MFMLQVEPNGEFMVEPQCILKRRETILQRRAITKVKVQWKHFSFEEATCEDEHFMLEAYLDLFKNQENTEDDVMLQGWNI